VRNAGSWKIRRDERRRKVVDASLTLSNGRNPRRTIQLHHGPATAEPGDTAWRLTHLAGKPQKWPA